MVQFAVSWATLAAPAAPGVPREGGGRVPSWQAAAVLSLTAGRSVVALAIALALPAQAPDGTPYPARDAVVALVAIAVIASHLLQWAVLPGMLRWARPAGEQEAEEETAEARHAASAADADDPEAARRRLRALRDEDRIGDAAMHAGETAAALRARAAEVAEPEAGGRG
ncbi:hypothetical protein ACE7GA_04195 [Roseomonas sp. CCTCC AB2023176]|uniref:hypothetical protein n=1 Tax=Roseomonas sp. CCTCC AB2023176 TaxID=3342640 RepID=UPI0035E0BAFE